MKSKKQVYLFFLFFCSSLLFTISSCLAQRDSDEPEAPFAARGFHVGLGMGMHFANSYTASIYDGYGFDDQLRKNDFLNSIMYRKIVLENGGVYAGQTDYIAAALNVNHGDWEFTELDMPGKMTYNKSFLFGIQTRTGVTNRDAILFNMDMTKLTVTGAFTITMLTSTLTAPTPGYQNIRTFTIFGSEQRLFFQMGYQRLLGETDNFCMYWEGGVNLVYTKFDKSRIVINNVSMDLTSYYDRTAYGSTRPRNLTGLGPGFFTGIGAHIKLSPKLTMEMGYDPAFNKIFIGADPKYKLEHSVTVRFYGKI